MERIEFIDNSEIGFFYKLREEFKKDLEFAETVIRNEGILKCEDFLFWLWVRDPEILIFISSVWNHEGFWEFEITSSPVVKSKIENMFKHQGLDCQLEIIFV